MNIQGPLTPKQPIERVLTQGTPAKGKPQSVMTTPSAEEGSSLWQILTPEEREFFEQISAVGAITYRPGGASATDNTHPTGQRVDVRG